jgi:hypothetical protein
MRITALGRMPEEQAVRLTGRVEVGRDRWAVLVQSASLLDKEGKVNATLTGEAPTEKIANPTLFQFCEDPEKYEGEKLVFKNTKLLSAGIRRGRDVYLEVPVANDKDARPEGVTFVMPYSVRDQLGEHTKLPPKQLVNVTCLVEKTFNNRWQARIIGVALVGKDGKVTATVPAK